MRSLGFRDFLDVAWAHYLSLAASGAFSNPFEVREAMIYAFYGGVKPKKHRDKDAPPEPVKPSEGVTRAKVDAMLDLQAQIDAARAASIPPSE